MNYIIWVCILSSLGGVLFCVYFFFGGGAGGGDRQMSHSFIEP